ncbi:unnamed protein product, partial [Didymodactylos carnosus]
MHIDLSNISKQEFSYYCRVMLPKINKQIVSIKLSNILTLDSIKRFSTIVKIEKFTQLNKLVLVQVKFVDLKHILSKLNNLKTLIIMSTDYSGLDTERLNILKMIFELKSLKKCHLPVIDVSDLDDLKTSNIEQLAVDHCTMSCLGKLFSYIPHIQRLSVNVYADMQNLSPMYEDKNNVPSLTFLTLNTNDIPFGQVELLLSSRNLSQLRHLSFSFKTYSCNGRYLDYVDSQKWESILSSLSLLNRFKFHIEIPINKSVDIDTLYLTFQRDFYHQRKWFIDFDMYSYLYDYILTIHTRPFSQKHIRTGLQTNGIYHQVKNLQLMIDSQRQRHSQTPPRKYPNVTSLTLIAAKPIDESSVLFYLSKSIQFEKLTHLNIQFDNCSKQLLLMCLMKSPN